MPFRIGIFFSPSSICRRPRKPRAPKRGFTKVVSSSVDPHEILRAFTDRTDRVIALLDGFMPECAWLDDSETLTYLHSCVSTKRHRVRVPETPIYLDAHCWLISR